MKSFNNIAGTTSTEFGLGVGTGNEVRQVVLNAVGSNSAVDREGNELVVSGVEFYDIKVLAKGAEGIVAKQLRGTVNGTTVTRIEDVFQEDFAADVTLTSDGTTLSVACTGSANFTIYATLTRVAE
jgi:hypothetical protein